MRLSDIGSSGYNVAYRVAVIIVEVGRSHPLIVRLPLILFLRVALGHC